MSDWKRYFRSRLHLGTPERYAGRWRGSPPSEVHARDVAFWESHRESTSRSAPDDTHRPPPVTVNHSEPSGRPRHSPTSATAPPPATPLDGPHHALFLEAAHNMYGVFIVGRHHENCPIAADLFGSASSWRRSRDVHTPSFPWIMRSGFWGRSTAHDGHVHARSIGVVVLPRRRAEQEVDEKNTSVVHGRNVQQPRSRRPGGESVEIRDLGPVVPWSFESHSVPCFGLDERIPWLGLVAPAATAMRPSGWVGDPRSSVPT